MLRMIVLCRIRLLADDGGGCAWPSHTNLSRWSEHSVGELQERVGKISILLKRIAVGRNSEAAECAAWGDSKPAGV